MPLIKSGSPQAISTNIREMEAAGHPHDQAIAAALSTARKYGRKAQGGEIHPLKNNTISQKSSIGYNNHHRNGSDRTRYAMGGMPAFSPKSYQAQIGVPQRGAPGVAMTSIPRGINPHPLHMPTPHTNVSMKIGAPHVGLIGSAIAGRTDKIPLKVRGGSYVVPADVVSGLGQGNTAAGAKHLSSFFQMGGPYGTQQKTIGAPKVNFGKMMSTPRGAMSIRPPHFAEGGTQGDKNDLVPIIAAGGEFVIPPDVVHRLGGGEMSEGHAVLDAWVEHERSQHIKTLKRLPGPKR